MVMGYLQIYQLVSRQTDEVSILFKGLKKTNITEFFKFLI